MPPLNTLEFVSFDDQCSVMVSVKEPRSTLALHQGMSPRKTVAFTAAVNARATIQRCEYSAEEKMAAWYTREEIASMRRNAKIDANMPLHDTYLRGLEGKTPQGARSKQQKRNEARAAVFLEQQIQDEDGFSDPDAIADACFECTEPCQAEAHMLALRDEKEAMEVHGSLKISDLKFPARIVLVDKVFAGSAAA
jgi:hypothetical protein